MVKVLPAARGKIVKNFLGFLVPGPPEITGQPIQADDELGLLPGRKRCFAHKALLKLSLDSAYQRAEQ
jgi:hypothetical protein